ncbi:hypothetical protein WN943_009376 [Citrus x changshan-huyou]
MVLIFERSGSFKINTIPMFIIIILLVSCASQVVSSRSTHEQSVVEMHEKWMAQHGRSYKDELEKEMRFKIFKENLEYIEKANKEGNRTYKLGTNRFSDLTNDEFRALYTGYKMPSPSHRSTTSSTFKYQNLSMTDVPTSLDWRDKKAVTPIKDQQECGCCWAFSAVAAVEGITKISGANLIQLSEQQLVDCSTNGNNGCGGGTMEKAFEYIIQNQGIATEDEYPYQAVQGTCSAAQKAAAAKISNYEEVPSGDEQALLKAVSMQPVSIGIAAYTTEFKSYKEGIFNGVCGTQLDHAVTIVGFGTTEDGANYWLIKNSWGDTWGDAGYMKILRDEGLCGIGTQSSSLVNDRGEAESNMGNLRDMIEEMRMDTRKFRYENLQELYLYCYYVAGTVGLMSVPVMGIAPDSSSSAQSIYNGALNLGVGNQLTNFLRDVGEDASRGRVYLPQDKLAQFVLCDKDVFARKVTDNWREFMKEQIKRARTFFNMAEEGASQLDKDSRWPVWSSLLIYREILDAIEENDYDNLTKRAYVGRMKKYLMLPQAYNRTQSKGSLIFPY